MNISLGLSIPMLGTKSSPLSQLQALGSLTFYKDYANNQVSADADYSVGSSTATVISARSSSAPATYVDSNGNIQLLTTANVLRFCSGYYNNDGLFLANGFMAEPQSTNLCLDGYFSQTFATYWRANATATVSSSSSVANKYLGGNVGKAICIAVNDGIITAVTKKPTFVNGTTYTVSALVSGSGTAKAYAKPDGMSAQYGNAITLDSSPKLVTLTFANTYNGVGSVGVVSNDSSTTIYVHTIQLEAIGNFTSFIPTTTASVTRPLEKLSYVVSGNRSSTTETIGINFVPLYDFNKNLLTQRVFIDTDTKQRRLLKTNSSAGGSMMLYPNFTDSNSSYSYGYEGIKADRTHCIVGVSYSPTDTNNTRIYLNSFDNSVNSVNYTEPAFGTSFYVGCDNGSNNQCCSIIKGVAIYSEALSDSSCKALSNILSYTGIVSVPGYFASNLSAESFLLINQPSAQYISSVNKTFICYSGDNFSAYATYYDHTSGGWANPVLVGESEANRDSHGSPAMLVDSSGYIHVVYGSHGGNALYSKSTNPYDISSWVTMSTPETDLSYPQLLQFSNNNIYLFYRKGGAHLSDMGYKVSTDGGTTWGSFNTVISYTSPSYAYYWYVRKGVADTIHVGMIWKDENNSKGASGDEATHRYNIYYFKYDGTKWVNGNGTDLTSIIPLDHTDLDTVGNNLILYNSGTVKCQIPVVEVNSSDYPHIFFVSGNLLTYTNQLIYWDGGAWQTKTCTGLGSSNMFSTYAFQVNSATSFTAYITGPNSRVSCGDTTTKFRGGDFEVWDSTNTGTTWTLRERIQSLSKELNYPARVMNSTASLRVVFCENTHANTVDFTNKGYGYGDSGILS